jgi:hypothetical protein
MGFSCVARETGPPLNPLTVPALCLFSPTRTAHRHRDDDDDHDDGATASERGTVALCAPG